MDDEVLAEAHRMCTTGEELVDESGKLPCGEFQPTWQERVQVASLRHAGTGGRTVGEPVPIEDGNPVEVVGEHPGHQDPGHAGTYDDGVVRRARVHHPTLGMLSFEFIGADLSPSPKSGPDAVVPGGPLQGPSSSMDRGLSMQP